MRKILIFFVQEEVRCEQRRRNLLVLILHYLQEEGCAVLIIIHIPDALIACNLQQVLGHSECL